MAYRYNPTLVEDGDIADPRDWDRAMQAFSSEFNGRLDRDNLPQDAITPAMVKAKAFTVIHQDEQTATLTLSGNRTDWRTDELINSKELICPQDCVLVCDWTGGWESTAAYLAWAELLLNLRIKVDGITLAISPNNDWGYRQKDAGALCGTIAVAAGNHIVTVESRIFRPGGSACETDLDFTERILVIEERRR